MAFESMYLEEDKMSKPTKEEKGYGYEEKDA